MTYRTELVNHIGYLLYKAGVEYVTTNRTTEGFKVDIVIAEIVSDHTGRNLKVTANVDSYDWRRLVGDIKKSAKEYARLYRGMG